MHTANTRHSGQIKKYATFCSATRQHITWPFQTERAHAASLVYSMLSYACSLFTALPVVGFPFQTCENTMHIL